MEWTMAKHTGGYGIIRYRNTATRVHRLTWELVHGEIPAGKMVLHHCDNRPCCNVDHLYIGTARENAIDMFARGRANRHPEKTRGENNGLALLTEEQVRIIRASPKKYGENARLARLFGVTESCVWRARHGKNWAHIQPAPPLELNAPHDTSVIPPRSPSLFTS